MYVVDILERCGAAASQTAKVYRLLADRFHFDPERVQLWRELALAEETHAEVLRRELRTFQEQDQSGAFLPEYEARLSTLNAKLKSMESSAAKADSLDEALAVAVALEQSTLEDIYDDLVLQGDPAFRVIAERLEAALSQKPVRALTAGLGHSHRR